MAALLPIVPMMTTGASLAGWTSADSLVEVVARTSSPRAARQGQSV
jgi:hypothetical protein